MLKKAGSQKKQRKGLRRKREIKDSHALGGNRKKEGKRTGTKQKRRGRGTKGRKDRIEEKVCMGDQEEQNRGTIK